MSDAPDARPASASRTVTTQLVFPEHANALGKAFGGQVMSWTDTCGGICAMRHSSGEAVTVSVDDLHFDRALSIGDIVIVEARVNATFHSSMEVEVTVDGENPRTRDRWRCVDARMTFVAIDPDGRPRRVVPLKLESDDDTRRAREAEARRTERLSKRKSAR